MQNVRMSYVDVSFDSVGFLICHQGCQFCHQSNATGATPIDDRLPEYLDPGWEHLHLLLTGALVEHRGHRPLHLGAPAHLAAGEPRAGGPGGDGDGRVGAGEEEAGAEGGDPRVRAEVGQRRQQPVRPAPVAARPLWGDDGHR